MAVTVFLYVWTLIYIANKADQFWRPKLRKIWKKNSSLEDIVLNTLKMKNC